MNQDEYLDQSKRNQGDPADPLLIDEARRQAAKVQGANDAVDAVASAGDSEEFQESKRILAEREAQAARAQKLLQAAEG